MFLNALPSLTRIGAYEAIVRNHERVPLEYLRAKNEHYVRVVETMWAKQPEDARRQSNGFYCFNPQPGRRVKSRIYICARLSGDPGKVVETWQAALHETGLQHKVYFKVPVELSRRFETIILYRTDHRTDAEIATLLAAFAQKCPSDLLNKHDMPTGVPLSRGISAAPEPANISTFHRYLGNRDGISYNQLITSIVQLSFELAYADLAMEAAPNSTPQTLREPARRYFGQMIELSGFSPKSDGTSRQL